MSYWINLYAVLFSDPTTAAMTCGMIAIGFWAFGFLLSDFLDRKIMSLTKELEQMAKDERDRILGACKAQVSELLAGIDDYERLIMVAGVVKDPSVPCGWRNRRAEAAETRAHLPSRADRRDA